MLSPDDDTLKPEDFRRQDHGNGQCNSAIDLVDQVPKSRAADYEESSGPTNLLVRDKPICTCASLSDSLPYGFCLSHRGGSTCAARFALIRWRTCPRCETIPSCLDG